MTAVDRLCRLCVSASMRLCCVMLASSLFLACGGKSKKDQTTPGGSTGSVSYEKNPDVPDLDVPGGGEKAGGGEAGGGEAEGEADAIVGAFRSFH